MFLKTFILLVLAALAIAYPQESKIKVDKPDVDVDAIENRVVFLTNTHHEPENAAEGGQIVVTYDPPSADQDEVARSLVKSFTIAIGTGSGTAVDDKFFMESEKLPIPTASSKYVIQLPQQMEGKQYCIVFTPYAEDGVTKPLAPNGVPMESLYETWFAIEGSLAEGTGPAEFTNTYDNSAAAQTTQTTTDRTAEQPAAAANTPQATPAANVNSGSITISPAITAFIAVLFACFFI